MKDKILNFCISFITKYEDYSEKDIAKLRYGLEGLYLTITKTIIIILLSFLFNITREIILVIILFNIIRFFGFGFHAEKSWQCLLMSIFNFVIIPLLLLSFDINLVITLIISAICILSFLLWAPADTIKRPLKCKKKRMIRKIFTVIVGFLFALVSIIFNKYRAIILSALIIQFIVINPLTYKLMKQPYNNYKNF